MTGFGDNAPSIDMVGLPPDSVVLTEHDAAAFLRVRVDTIRHAKRTGQLKSILIGRHRRFLLADVLDYIKHQRAAEQ